MGLFGMYRKQWVHPIFVLPSLADTVLHHDDNPQWLIKKKTMISSHPGRYRLENNRSHAILPDWQLLASTNAPQSPSHRDGGDAVNIMDRSLRGKVKWLLLACSMSTSRLSFFLFFSRPCARCWCVMILVDWFIDWLVAVEK